jgi:multicomponent Na+:H+ antiporter subunit E
MLDKNFGDGSRLVSWRRRTKFDFSMGLTLAALWFALSGYTTPLLSGFGVASTLFVCFLSIRMGVCDEEGLPIYVHWWALIKYVMWLTMEIVKANIDVTKQVLAPRLKIAPVVVRLPARQRTAVGRVIYANSITLTPGTVAIELDGECVDVHSLSHEGAADLERGEMHARVCSVELVTDV